MVAFMPARKEITQLTLTGEWSDGRITNVCPIYCTNIQVVCKQPQTLTFCYVHLQAVELCMDACSKLGEILRDRLKEATLTSE